MKAKRQLSQGKTKPQPAKSKRRNPISKDPYVTQGIRVKNRQTSVANAYSTGQSSYTPNITSTRGQSRIRHRELVASIVGSSTYGINQTIQLNPGLYSSFPWLATQAVGWEQYRFNKLEYQYFTRASSLTTGSVILAPDYDAADAPPGSERIASAYEDTMEDSPWKDIVCCLNVPAMHPDGRKKFIRTASLGPNLDIKTYDVGTLYVCTTDGGSVNWGKLWVEYDITFYVPQLPPSGSFSVFQSLIGFGGTTANPLGNVLATPIENSQLFTYTPGTTNQITFLQGGTFLFNFYVGSNNTASGSAEVSTGGMSLSSGSFGSYQFNPSVQQSTGGFTYECSGTALLNVFAGSILNAPFTIVPPITGSFQTEFTMIAVPSTFG